MSALLPAETTAGDLCKEALRECGAFGLGQTPTGQDITEAQTRLQWMLQQWERQRWLVWHLVDLHVVSTGALSYTVGPGGDLNTNPYSAAFGPQFGVSARPNRIEAAFVRQLVNSAPNQVDYWLRALPSREDYDKLALKSLSSFPGFYFYDSAWPLGNFFPWPVPNPTIYEIHITVREQLPVAFATAATPVSIPYEYYMAIMQNLAMRLRAKYGLATPPGDPLMGQAKAGLAILRKGNAQITNLQMPSGLVRDGIYNIFSDQTY